jgi:hypothetical protein
MISLKPITSPISPVGAPTGFPVNANLSKKNTSSFFNFLSLFSYKYNEQTLFIIVESIFSFCENTYFKSSSIFIFISLGCYNFYINFLD